MTTLALPAAKRELRPRARRPARIGPADQPYRPVITSCCRWI